MRILQRCYFSHLEYISLITKMHSEWHYLDGGLMLFFILILRKLMRALRLLLFIDVNEMIR